MKSLVQSDGWAVFTTFRRCCAGGQVVGIVDVFIDPDSFRLRGLHFDQGRVISITVWLVCLSPAPSLTAFHFDKGVGVASLRNHFD